MTLSAENDWGVTSFSKMFGSFIVDSFVSIRASHGLNESTG
jgi:hypothetical protein